MDTYLLLFIFTISIRLFMPDWSDRYEGWFEIELEKSKFKDVKLLLLGVFSSIIVLVTSKLLIIF